jgi:hypothetical protein
MGWSRLTSGPGHVGASTAPNARPLTRPGTDRRLRPQVLSAKDGLTATNSAFVISCQSGGLFCFPSIVASRPVQLLIENDHNVVVEGAPGHVVVKEFQTLLFRKASRKHLCCPYANPSILVA